MDEKTKKIVYDIKKKEEDLYKDIGLKFDIETPTVIQYYKENLKNGSFSLKKNSFIDVTRNLLLGTCRGFASGTSNNICIFSRRFGTFLSLSIEELKDELPYQEMFVANTTFHEIRHIIQNFGYLSAYEYFCCRNLSDYQYQGLKAYVNRSFHDSIYKEIDANLYGMIKSKDYFSGNKDIEEYFKNEIGKYAVQKYTYDFDENLEKYQKKNENESHKVGSLKSYEQFLWNYDGTFKTPKELLNTGVSTISFISAEDSYNHFYEYIEKYPEVKDFYPRVISSDVYLSRLNMEELDIEEINFIKDMIKKNIEILENDKANLGVYYIENMISESEFQKAVFIINSRISRKKRSLQKLIGKGEEEKVSDLEAELNEMFSGNEQDKQSNEKTDSEFLENLTVQETLRKIKNTTKPKERLKKIIDSEEEKTKDLEAELNEMFSGNEQGKQSNEKTGSEFLENLTVQEIPRKIKSTTKSKERLKKIIDDMTSKIPASLLISAGSLYACVIAGVVNPDLAGIVGGSVLSGGLGAAYDMYKHKSKR